MTIDKEAIVQWISKRPGISQKELCDWFVSEKHMAARKTFLKALDELYAVKKIKPKKSGKSVTYTSCGDMTKKELEKTLECVLNGIKKELCKIRTEIPKSDYDVNKEMLDKFSSLESQIQKSIKDAISDSDERKRRGLILDRSDEIEELLKNMCKKDKSLKNQIFDKLHHTNIRIHTKMLKLQEEHNEQMAQYRNTRDKRKQGSIKRKLNDIGDNNDRLHTDVDEMMNALESALNFNKKDNLVSLVDRFFKKYYN